MCEPKRGSMAKHATEQRTEAIVAGSPQVLVTARGLRPNALDCALNERFHADECGSRREPESNVPKVWGLRSPLSVAGRQEQRLHNWRRRTMLPHQGWNGHTTRTL